MTIDADVGDGGDEPPIVIGSREQLLHLLAEAAEVEHTLMCSYLYAAFSLKRAGEPGVSAVQGEALERWRTAIIDVAVEEMGHLVIVANLTVAIGGRLGGATLFLGEVASQLGPEVTDLEGVRPIGSLADAERAIDTVVEQGEGSAADRDDSHYRSFMAIREELDRLTRTDPIFAPAWPVADSPVLRRARGARVRRRAGGRAAARLRLRDLWPAAAVPGAKLRAIGGARAGIGYAEPSRANAIKECRA